MLRQRESKWLDMLNNWDKWMAKKHKKVSDSSPLGGGSEGQPGTVVSLWGSLVSLVPCRQASGCLWVMLLA